MGITVLDVNERTFHDVATGTRESDDRVYKFQLGIASPDDSLESPKNISSIWKHTHIRCSYGVEIDIFKFYRV